MMLINSYTPRKTIPLPKHKIGIKDQAHAFYFFARGVFKAIKKQKYNLFIATSSRLMTAFMDELITKRVRAKLYLDIHFRYLANF